MSDCALPQPSDVGHISQKPSLYPRSQVRLLNFLNTVHRPSYKLWNLNKARLSRLAVHDDDDEIVDTTPTFKTDRQARPCRRCHSRLDA